MEKGLIPVPASSGFSVGLRGARLNELLELRAENFDSMMGDTIFLHSKRHLMTLRHQNIILPVMSVTCDHLAIQSAIPKAHPTPTTSLSRKKTKKYISSTSLTELLSGVCSRWQQR